MNYSFRTVSIENTTQLKEKGSRFIAFIFPIQSELHFKKRMIELKSDFPDAVHHCFAFRLISETNLERFSDDGEPSGTAGKPILGQLKSADISNCALVVVRYFGGIKLGTGGLIKAYKTVAKQVIENATIVLDELKTVVKISCGFEQSGNIMSLLKKHRVEIRKKIGSDLLELEILVPIGTLKALENEISQLDKTRIIHPPQ